jgi:hypothetical protein
MWQEQLISIVEGNSLDPDHIADLLVTYEVETGDESLRGCGVEVLMFMGATRPRPTYRPGLRSRSRSGSASRSGARSGSKYGSLSGSGSRSWYRAGSWSGSRSGFKFRSGSVWI